MEKVWRRAHFLWEACVQGRINRNPCGPPFIFPPSRVSLAGSLSHVHFRPFSWKHGGVGTRVPVDTCGHLWTWVLPTSSLRVPHPDIILPPPICLMVQ